MVASFTPDFTKFSAISCISMCFSRPETVRNDVSNRNSYISLLLYEWQYTISGYNKGSPPKVITDFGLYFLPTFLTISTAMSLSMWLGKFFLSSSSPNWQCLHFELHRYVMANSIRFTGKYLFTLFSLCTIQ